MNDIIVLFEDQWDVLQELMNIFMGQVVNSLVYLIEIKIGILIFKIIVVILDGFYELVSYYQQVYYICQLFMGDIYGEVMLIFI